MLQFSSIPNRFQHLGRCLHPGPGLHLIIKSLCCLITSTYRFILHHANSFLVQLCYFISFSFFGFLILKSLKPRTFPVVPRDLDLFFTSVSAVTVSSMSTVEMEVFSNAQLIILTVLMFVGGEVFISMAVIRSKCAKLIKPWNLDRYSTSRVNSVASTPAAHSDNEDDNQFETIELGYSISSTSVLPRPPAAPHDDRFYKTRSEIEMQQLFLKYNSTKLLGYIVLGYLLTIHVIGISTVVAYINIIPSAKKILQGKDLKVFTFSLFTVVSTFASCGFVPTNENMAVFRNNTGLLLILVPHLLLGNTLFPPFLRLTIWILGKLLKKNESIAFLLKNTNEIGYFHLVPSVQSLWLVMTVLGFVLAQFILFCSMQWHSEALSGLDSYEKLVGALFMSINSRHTGETIVDLSTIAPSMLVLFVVMMYLPPYTCFMPVRDKEQSQLVAEEGIGKKNTRVKILENLIFSQLGYLVIFVIIICVTERHKMKEDPLNFNVFTIVVEVISAYGNVGFSTGYSCGRQLKPDANCVNKSYGFSGTWSDQGKIILIIVMFFGRLKKFNMDGGKAWKLL